MLTIRPAAERGQANFGWLNTHHTFSFGDYQDYDHMGFHSLRVMNDDRIAGGGGFPMHPHRDMEILTWVLQGALEHKDSLGTGSVIRAGDLQRMTAGTGIRHSEFNPSKTEAVHLLQIWLHPREVGLKPSYTQTSFPPEERQGQLKLIASPDGRDGSLSIQQDADLFAANLDAGQHVKHTLAPGRAAWVQVATGSITLNGRTLNTGDGAAIEDETSLELICVEPGETVVFDLV